MQLQIAAAVLLAFLALLPPVILALYHLGRALHLTTGVVERDVRIVASVESLGRHVLLARSELQALLIDHDPRHLDRARARMRPIPDLLDECESALGSRPEEIRVLRQEAAELAWRADSLVALVVRADAARAAASAHHAEIQDIVEAMLGRLAGLEDGARSQLQSERARILAYTQRARRDIVTVLLLTVLVEGVLLVVLPRRILGPVRRLTRVVRQVSQGRHDVRAEARDDEVGELAEALNRMLETMATLEGLKRDKIAEMNSRFRALAQQLEFGILVLGADLVPQFANRWLRAQVGWDEAEREPDLRRLFDDAAIDERIMRTLMVPDRDRFGTSLRTNAGPQAVELVCRGAVDGRGDVASVVIVVRPQPAAASSRKS